jgi:YidC/Oxa1 family membrane protein insertase
MSDQKRVVLAAALSLLVIVVWSLLYRPAAPRPGTPTSPAPSSVPAGVPAAGAPTGGTTNGAAQPAVPAVAAGGVPAAVVGETAERGIVVESDLYRVVLSNRGAVVRSWQLKQYDDSNRPPRQLDLVNAAAAQQSGSWPFSLKIADAQLEQAANQALYVLAQPSAGASADATLTAPAEVEFRWSDGQFAVTKRLKFDSSYVVQVETSVQRQGQPVAHRIAWRGGFGDSAAFQVATRMQVFSGLAGSISVISVGNLGLPDQRTTPADRPGSFDVVGIEDLYFAAAFLPPEPPPGQPLPAVMTLSDWQLVRTIEEEGQSRQETLPEMAAGSTATGPLVMRVFLGPKDLDVLKTVRPPLNGLVRFGWSGFIAEPLFYVLRWLHGYVPNYGWAIVVLTIAINTLLYPLKLKSWRSMQRMQKVAPEIRAIQDRYKKYSMRDPRKQEMNKEVMAVYGREGINPLGSCLPMVAQMPIWFGLYSMLMVAIELRHASWIGWIDDLSRPDPYYILPVTMAVLMYAAQKMTPTTITDPAQQRMMNLMPIMFGGMFIFFPVSSGLVLYILSQNVIGIAQQWHLNRTSPLKVPVKRAAK